MFVIGELINGMYLTIARAIRERDAPVIQKCAKEQIASGADALDVNCGPSSRHPVDDMCWLVETIQSAVPATLVLDSSKPSVIEAGLKAARNAVIINSTTADPQKLDALIPLAKQFGAKLIGLALNSKGVPQNRDQRLELAASIVASCIDAQFPIEDLYLDPVVLPVNVGQQQMLATLEVIRDFKVLSDPAPKTVIGLSNVSQGTAVRGLINRVFLVMAVAFGLDAAILDPKDRELMDSLITAELILNKQIYCDSFLEAYRRK